MPLLQCWLCFPASVSDEKAGREVSCPLIAFYLSHAKAKESVFIAASMIGFAMSSVFWPFAKITTPDFPMGSAMTKALNTPLSPQCHRAMLPFVRCMPQPNPQNRFFDSSFGSCLMQIRQLGSSAIYGVSIWCSVDGESPFPFRIASTSETSARAMPGLQQRLLQNVNAMEW